ncbi:MAG: polysaccharide biosynthesis protein [Firmicutes bacterium]|nr:polysaccharide biosynthesis protein [Bacillota bacterium]
MSTTRVFLRGAIILAIATIVSKLFGSVYTIVLQNMIGDRGMGLYNMAYPVYSTLLIISTAGFPVAVSKYVSEYVAIGDLRSATRIYRVSLWMLSAVGLIGAIMLYAFAPFFAQLAGDERAVWAIRAIAPALLIVPAMSSMRGYFQGWQMMEPTAASQIFEQIVRVVTILVGAYFALRLGYGDPFAAASAAFGAVTGGLAGMLVMGFFFWRYRHPQQLAQHTSRGLDHSRAIARVSTREIVKKLIYYAIPVSLGALVIPIISNVDALTVTNLLKGSGLSQAVATRDFGILSGRAFKLMMLPAALASSIGVALMPAVSEAHAMRDQSDTAARALMGLRMTLLFALPASIGLFILAKPIDIALFRNAAGFHSIQILGFATLFSTLQIALAASLQGVGAVYLPLRSLLIGTVAKVVLNYLLVPRLGIDGAALATVGSYALASILNFISLYKLLNMRINWRDLLLRPAGATFIMGAFTFAVYAQWQRLHVPLDTRMSAAAATVMAILVAGVIYLLSLILSGTLREQEVASLPKIGTPLVGALRRIGLFAS